MPLTTTETEICDRWDAGQSRQRIVRETGITPCIVTRTVAWCGNDEQRRHRTMMAAGSAALAAAIGRERQGECA